MLEPQQRPQKELMLGYYSSIDKRIIDTMDKQIKEQNIFTGVDAWHEKGWKGDGVSIWNCEGMTEHGKMTRSRIIDAAPNAKILNAREQSVFDGGEYKELYIFDDEQKLTIDEFIKKHKISILSHSHNSPSEKLGHVPWYEKLQSKYNLLYFNSDGNTGFSSQPKGSIPEPVAIYVGACIAFANDYKDIRIANYSTAGDEFEEVDFSTFVGKSGWSGTSFSTPYLAGMAALLLQRYGKDMTQKEMYHYFKMISRPIDTGYPDTDHPGYDFWSGYGIPILPSPDKRYVVMQIGKKAYKVDGVWNEMDTAPFIEKSRTFVPIAFAAIALGAQVYWDGKEYKVTILKGFDKLEMWIGKETYSINGETKKMDVAPFIKNSRTFVPIAFAALALNCKVAWVEKERKVLILEQ